MRKAVTLAAAALLALAGCGDDDESTDSRPASPAATETAPGPTTAGGGSAKRPKPAAKGTRIVLAGSEFGSMLFDSRKQAIYIFQRDRRNESACYGECADAWPPVLTEAKPVAGGGVRQALLGTMRRRDGKLQATYAGQPLYFYAHEGPGEVRCHNVNLNGGLWWVVGPDGRRRP
jgi:predicted lipoprotein with Yx(FWY)xxD motif